jgi:coenzyme F420-0:L-glutamate ligase/coenzyme F420-1:gamma-L-glutamate ligase|tara:strand:- start:81 stop:779 length:699 start_codon:yes stop_codon:yes gene_type:complete
MNKVSIIPIMNLPEFDTGHEIVEELIKSLEENKISLEDSDVIVITQKIISKVEGRKIDINKEDIEEVIKSESLQIIRKRGETVIAKTKHGFICANAGIDKSNIEEGSALLLPEDPDKTSRDIRKKIEHKTGKKISVIICDTFGRAWRKGQTNVAIGSSGIEPLESYIGEKDTFDNELFATEIAIVDELAGAAELVMKKSDNIPIVVIKGVKYNISDLGVDELIRDAQEDFFL